MKAFDKVKSCKEQIRKRTDFVPTVAIVLGSGLGEYEKCIDVKESISYREIEGFPVSTISGHKGRLIFGWVDGVPVVVMSGRVHYYEGYEIPDVVLPIRLMHELGAEKLILTNAAGALNPDYRPGDFMLIRDQIVSFMPSPLRGPNEKEWGTRFPGMEDIYHAKYRERLKKWAEGTDVHLQEGVYVQLPGPAYESPAEVKMCQLLGGDAVGMSTAVEAVAARHMGMKIIGISCITNMGCGIGKVPLSHQDVREMGRRTAPQFQKIILAAIQL